MVTDPAASLPGVNAGAVHLYSPLGVLISTLTGSAADNQIGSGGVTVLANGNFVVSSPSWDNGAVANVGAVTWASASTGRAGAVSAANSLIGTAIGDQVGSAGVTALVNGNYVVRSPSWDNGAVANVGAVTWADGAAGLAGAVSAANSLVGSISNDSVGNAGVYALGNGNYVVGSSAWDNGLATNAGAVTWADGSTGISGAVSPGNSLVGSATNDQVGESTNGVTVLANSNYVVRSRNWDNGAVANVGAVTWAPGSAGRAGPVSVANSLVGSAADDLVGADGVRALSNGHYVVSSSLWNNGAVADVGAVTWGSGTSGGTGAVSASNSLIGTASADRIGNLGVAALANGNYVVASSLWDNGASVDAGAATWANGGTGLIGNVSTSNSLVGATLNADAPDKGVTALGNGNYVVSSPFWSNVGVSAVGAVTWANGATGLVGAVSSSNSLIGRRTNDFVGFGGVVALSNGNFVVISPFWDNDSSFDDGAVTWANGATGMVGMVTPLNSRFGSLFNDFAGTGGATALSNGHYVVRTPTWDNGNAQDAGAATWGTGLGPSVGAIAPGNSLTGIVGGDLVSSGAITALANGYYAVASPVWDNGAVLDAGAVTLGRGDAALAGPIVAAHSVRGTLAGGGSSMPFAFDAARAQLAVGRPASNIVSLLTLSAPLAELIFANGFE